MQKTIYIDAGNTRIKAASCTGEKWKSEGSWSYIEPELKTNLLEVCRSCDRIVISSVKNRKVISGLLGTLTDGRRNEPEVLVVDRKSIPEDRIDYRTPETLGSDRFLACLGAWSISEKEGHRSVIVTDTGTACTIDVMDAEGVFRGGVIMPGVQMLIDTLAGGAGGLFPVDAELPDSWPPDSTEAAIKAGTAGSFLAAWEAHIGRNLEIYPGSQLWITGGDAPFIAKHTKRSCRVHDYLVFEGMQEWLKIR